MFITIFDTVGIQEYLFSSNRLAENIGASYLVNEAIDRWPMEAALKVCPGRVNPAGLGILPALPGILGRGCFDLELLYSAGGNAIFLVGNEGKEKSLATEYSRILIERAPGLDVAIHHYKLHGGAFEIGKGLSTAFREVAAKKQCRAAGTPLAGLGVAQLCFSGLQEPAIDRDPTDKNRFLGPTALAKMKNRERANAHLKAFLQKAIPGDCDVPAEFDDLGRSKGEKSFVGVVHVDGNGIGKRLQDLLERTCKSNEEKLRDIRTFSSTVAEVGSGAVRAAMDLVVKNWEPHEKRYAGRLDPVIKNRKYCLPIRPLIYGGDDITLVCDGRIALDVAATCLKAFEKEASLFKASAGVAMVKAHYPFSRAYAAAKELCFKGKRYLHDKRIEASALNWQIISGGPLLPIDDIRNRQYVASDGKKLTCRPYLILPENNKDVRNWDNFRKQLLLKLQQGEPWSNARSRLRGLAFYLRRGEAATKAVLQDWERKEYTMPQYSTSVLSAGFYGDETPYLDALELLDLFVPLKL